MVGANLHPKQVQSQFKAYATRRLRDHLDALGYDFRKNWWTEGGSQRYLNTVESLEAAIHYVLYEQ